MKILALDIAQVTGWAAGDGTPQTTRYGTHDFGWAADDYGRLSWKFSDWLADKITEHEPDLVAIERGFFRGPQSYHLSGLIWDANRVAYLREVSRVEYTTTSIKKFIANAGHATKRAVIERILARGFFPATDHEADAIALLLLARERAMTKEAA